MKKRIVVKNFKRNDFFFQIKNINKIYRKINNLLFWNFNGMKNKTFYKFWKNMENQDFIINIHIL